MFSKYKHFIFTENPDELVKFYTDYLEWNIVGKLEYEKDYGYALEISPGGMQVWLAEHSEVSGKNEDPYRQMLNLYTDHVEYLYNKVKDHPGVTVVAEPFHMSAMNPEETERWACTILDPDGNSLQFMGKLQPEN